MTINKLRKDIKRKSQNQSGNFKSKIKTKRKREEKFPVPKKPLHLLSISNLHSKVKIRSMRIPKWSKKAKSQDYSKKQNFICKNLDKSLNKSQKNCGKDRQELFPKSEKKSFIFAPKPSTMKRRKNLKSKQIQRSIFAPSNPKPIFKNPNFSKKRNKRRKPKPKHKHKSKNKPYYLNKFKDKFNPFRPAKPYKIAKIRLKSQSKLNLSCNQINPRKVKISKTEASFKKVIGSIKSNMNSFITGEYLFGAENVSEVSNPMYLPETEVNYFDCFEEKSDGARAQKANKIPKFKEFFSRSMDKERNMSSGKNYSSKSIYNNGNQGRIFKMRFK